MAGPAFEFAAAILLTLVVTAFVLGIFTAASALSTIFPRKRFTQYSVRTAILGVTGICVLLALLRVFGGGFVFVAAVVGLLLVLGVALVSEFSATFTSQDSALRRLRDRPRVITADPMPQVTEVPTQRPKRKRRKWWQIRWPNRYHGYGPGRNQRDPVELGQRW